MKVLQVEFNELSPELLTRFMAAGHLPNFSRLHDSSAVFTTDAHAGPPNLEPWIQWPSVHLGVPYEEHGLHHLGARPGDAEKDGTPRPGVAQVASDAGLRVGVFGSMNVPYTGLNGFFVPDAWHTEVPAFPDSLAPYVRTVGAMVRDSSRTEGETPDAGVAAFGAFLLRHGLTPRTVGVLARQLLAERKDPGLRWRRASALDWIQYDVFRNYARRTGIDFGTFFSNSTAHYQHYFWRHMNPEQFVMPPEPTDHPSFAGAVLFGYRSMDRILGRILHDFPDAAIVFCTALSQQPWPDATKQTYRPRDWAALLGLVGLTTADANIQTIMAEEFVARFPSEEAAVRAEQAFGRLHVDGRPLMEFTREGDALIGGCAVNEAGATALRITGTADGSEPVMGDVFTPIHTVRSGRHSSVGALWIRAGRHVVHDEPVDVEDIAPTVLDLLGVAAPPHMKGSVLPVAGLAARR